MSFYTETAFRRWDSTGWKIKYYKGLGTSTSQEAREYFKALDKLTVSFTHDEGTLDSMVLAFDKTKADSRKEWLVHNTEKSPSEREIDYGTTTRVTITDFVHRDLVNFSLADVRRSIAHMCDGLKPSQRKVMYACFAKNLKEEMKVAQLAAYVSEKTAYHHGETSLADTIVKLANDFVGSNNVNLLEPCGQFGTRLMGGKDASQTRYIFTKLTPSARSLFDVRDDPVLNYLDDDGKPIEPEYYVPVLPTVLINGTEGIGTGFSSSVPSFNPNDVRENILRALRGDTLRPMTPWFRGFKGTVVSEDGVWVSKGVYTTTASGDLHITELPPGRWTQDYKEYLDTLVEKKVISSYTNRSTVETVDFVISGYTGTGAAKDFKLHKTIHTGNMHLFHPTTGIKRYSSPEEILVDFIQVRIKVYKKRKDNLIREITLRKKVIDNKVRFISAVVNEKLVVFKKRKADLEKEMAEIGFERIDDSYDYLLRTATYEYTLEAIAKLNDEQKRLTLELDTLVRTQPLDMWKQDLDK
jgi:DNA topoisomerase-2